MNTEMLIYNESLLKPVWVRKGKGFEIKLWLCLVHN